MEDTAIAPVRDFGETLISRVFETARDQGMKARAEEVERTRQDEDGSMKADNKRASQTRDGPPPQVTVTAPQHGQRVCDRATGYAIDHFKGSIMPNESPF